MSAELTPLQKLQLQKLRDLWIGVKVRIIDPIHPQWQKVGTVSGFEQTTIGWAMRVDLHDGQTGYVRRKRQISIVDTTEGV